MKTQKIIKMLERPRVIIPATLVIAVVIGGFLFTRVGRVPEVVIGSDQTASTTSPESTDNTFDLSFPKTGRLLTLAVAEGSQVKKGEVIASLDAADAQGAVNQAKGALELATAQYASMDVQYANAKKQQDVLVANAYRTLLSSGLEAVARKVDGDSNATVAVDNSQTPKVSGTYTCTAEGEYDILPYQSGAATGYSFTFSGLEKGVGNVTYFTPQALGNCGLSIQFPEGYSSPAIKWVIAIPNKTSSEYVANKNAYDLAVATRNQVLTQFETNLGKNGTADGNIAQAQINAARGAYEAALAAYNNNLIIAPIDGVVTFIDSHLKIGQTITANKTVITIEKK